MSEYLSKKDVLEWLNENIKDQDWPHEIRYAFKHVREKIQSGVFDTPERREKPQVSSSHTWTQDGNTYFVSYVEYCPTCYHVISTSARL